MSGYKDYKLNEIYLKGIAKKYPELVRYYELGKKTHLGNPIPAVQITRDNLIDEKPTVLFNCAHHANELISTEHCYDIMYNLLANQEKYSSYLDNLVIWFVPIVNQMVVNSFGIKAGLWVEKMDFCLMTKVKMTQIVG
jgi:hypothetical protein